MKYRAIFKINGVEKPLATFNSYDEAYQHCMEHRKKNSTLECFYVRVIKKDNVTTLDYGAHNAFYKIEEINLWKRNLM